MNGNSLLEEGCDPEPALYIDIEKRPGNTLNFKEQFLGRFSC